MKQFCFGKNIQPLIHLGCSKLSAARLLLSKKLSLQIKVEDPNLPIQKEQN